MKFNLIRSIGVVVCAGLLIAGCATDKAGDKPKFSGYLGDYSNLEPIKGEGGDEIRRWVNPKLKKGQYTKLQVDPIVFYPAPQASKQVTLDTLYKSRRYADEALRRELAKSYLIVHQAGPGVARVRIALTGITTEPEKLKSYEYVPMAAIAAGIATATGARDRQAFVLVEAEVQDSVTNEVLGRAVRKAPAKKLLPNDKEELTFAMIKPLLDEKADNARRALDRYLK